LLSRIDGTKIIKQDNINPAKERFSPAQISVTPPAAFAADFLIRLPRKNSEPFGNNEDINNIYFNQVEKVSNVPRSVKELPDFSKTPFKIGVAVDQKQAEFTIPNGTLYVENADGKTEIGTFENTAFKVKTENGTLALYQDDKLLGSFKGKIKLEGNLAPVLINNKKYHGDFEVIINPQNPNSLNVINNVLVEDYLKGVVPSESSASWPVESLKAQAIAARTYAIANWKRRENMGFDLMATVSDQVYNGIGVEQDSTSQAVEETRNQVILFAGKPINALFFACSGGYTDSSKEVWNIDLPYIQAVPDFDQEAPKYHWKKTISNAALQDALKQMGYNIGAIKEIEPLELTPQKRVKTIKFTGTDGTVVADSNKFRFAAGLNSTLWTVEASDSKKFSIAHFQRIPQSFNFNGGGWGHGLGMSQWGARQMSVDGKTAEEILKHYYTGVEIADLKPGQ
jgi:stage II sporulation protein D